MTQLLCTASAAILTNEWDATVSYGGGVTKLNIADEDAGGNADTAAA
jgi:hypothetical protein